MAHARALPGWNGTEPATAACATEGCRGRAVLKKQSPRTAGPAPANAAAKSPRRGAEISKSNISKNVSGLADDDATGSKGRNSFPRRSNVSKKCRREVD